MGTIFEVFWLLMNHSSQNPLKGSKQMERPIVPSFPNVVMEVILGCSIFWILSGSVNPNPKQPLYSPKLLETRKKPLARVPKP